MKTMLLIFLMMSSLLVFAEEENCDPTPSSVRPLVAVANAVKSSSTCPNGDKLPNLCIAIGTAEKDLSGKNQFKYQQILREAACVQDNDSESVVSQKIRTLWTQFENKLICNNTRFDVLDGNMLKFAASARFEDFLFDAAMVWKVNLNRIDPSDNRTVLDYVKKEIEKNKGSALEKKLQTYYDMLRSSGAKHRSEL